MVTTAAGLRYAGPAAKVEIKVPDATKPPRVEVTFSASGPSGETWAAYAEAPPEFLKTQTLSAPVTDRPLQPGEATVQVSAPGREPTLAPSGRITLRLHEGVLSGEATGTSNEFAAKFEGPFVVTCSVPASLMGTDAPAPAAGESPTLVVDERFESAPCRPYGRQ